MALAPSVPWGGAALLGSTWCYGRDGLGWLKIVGRLKDFVLKGEIDQNKVWFVVGGALIGDLWLVGHVWRSGLMFDRRCSWCHAFASCGTSRVFGGASGV